MMKLFDNLFRVALLVILVAGLVLATWHISWLHNQPESRYEIRAGEGPIVILDRQARVVYAVAGIFGDQPVVWRTSPLPNKP
ncbi:MAG TPA: hypothetical protein DC054_09375 [Blastocatellia bacterium]|nr:hypothetical protein [Blastocatellia bacterium]